MLAPGSAEFPSAWGVPIGAAREIPAVGRRGNGLRTHLIAERL
jgi:hypothetical protein